MLLEYLFFDKSKRSLVEQLNKDLQEHWGKLKKDGSPPSITYKDFDDGDCWIVRYEKKGNSEQTAIQFSEISENVCEEFSPTILTDESAEYFNKSLYPLVNQFERRLRKLLYLKVSLSNEENNDYVYFELLQPQTLKNRDGSNYSSRVDSTAYPFEFTEVYMMLSSEEGNDEAVFYVVVKYVNNKTEDVNELTEYVIKLTTRGNTFAIYDHYNPQED